MKYRLVATSPDGEVDRSPWSYVEVTQHELVRMQLRYRGWDFQAQERTGRFTRRRNLRARWLQLMRWV
jgi:hypothetical protein